MNGFEKHGITHLYKWHELEDILDRIRVIKEEDDEEDDTP